MQTTSAPRIRSLRFLVLVAVLFATLLGGATPVLAHNTTDESILIAIDEQQVIVTAPVPFTEIGYVDTSGDGGIDLDEFAEQETTVAASLVSTVRDHVQLSVNGSAVEIAGAGIPSLSVVGIDNEDATGARFVMLVLVSNPFDGEVNDVEVDWTFNSPSSSVVLSDAGGAVVGEFSETGTATFTLDTWSSATSFFALGIEHIQFGPDHLLFLLVLTLAVAGTAVTRNTSWRAVKLVTAFTIGHAISLSLAYFDVISIPAAIVEPAISLSIVGAAVLAIRGQTSDMRLWTVGFIGLIHGLGFASSLSSLGVATSQRVAALAAFNLGIDLAQTIVVLCVLGVLWLSSQVLAGRVVWLRTSAATCAALFGLVWTASRLTELLA